MKETKDSNKASVTAEDRARLDKALLDLGTSDYESIRAELIERLGYDQFRDEQNAAFKRIVKLEVS